jgi:hypothetical protein
MMGALPPNPRDLALLFSRMDDAFCFTGNSTCRTIEMLDRRIGQRRDATRAPIQARNGWRPHGRLLGQPATPSKDRRNFVQTMGSTSPMKPAICNSKIFRPEFLAVFAQMGDDLNIDPTFIMALAVQESGWNLSHVFEKNSSSNGKPLNNLFGETNAGGKNLAFASIQDSATHWDNNWAPYLSDHPSTIQGFVNDLTSTPGHMYNTNPDWKTNIAGGKLSNGKRTIGTYKSVLNALDKCDIVFP